MTTLQTYNKPSSRWCFTLNNYEGYPEFACTYMIYGKEIGENGTPHLQGYCVFAKVKRLSAVKKLLPTAHWEIARGTTDDNVNYCSKEGDFVEVGERPKSRKEVGEDNKARWADVIRAAKEGTCEEEYPKEFVCYNATITRLNNTLVADIPVYEGIWAHGPPGTGKSRWARETYPNHYKKMANRWWDGYEGEEEVILDDFSHKHAKGLGYYLKIWCDHGAFRAEFKGGSRVIRPKVFVVTSNYTIQQLFGEDPDEAQAVQRRFSNHYFAPPL